MSVLWLLMIIFFLACFDGMFLDGAIADAIKSRIREWGDGR